MVEAGTPGDPEFDAFAKDFDNQPLHKMFGIRLVERRPGFASITLRKTEDTPQGIGGSVHGGILAAMVDIVQLVAVFADRRPNEMPAGTADLNISYLRPALGENIRADATVVKRGRQLAMVEVSIFDDEERLCSKGRVLYAFRAVG